jgi:hypothetical protein
MFYPIRCLLNGLVAQMERVLPATLRAALVRFSLWLLRSSDTLGQRVLPSHPLMSLGRNFGRLREVCTKAAREGLLRTVCWFARLLETWRGRVKLRGIPRYKMNLLVLLNSSKPDEERSDAMRRREAPAFALTDAEGRNTKPVRV